MDHAVSDDTTELIEKLTYKVEGLEEALLSRDVIGQAKGILMERLHITPDQAFEELRTVSQQHNMKLKEVAAELAQTGEWPVLISQNGNGNGNGHGNGHTSPPQ